MEEEKIKETYFVVHTWMIQELGLKGIARDVYAIIYGFSRDNAGLFYQAPPL